MLPGSGRAVSHSRKLTVVRPRAPQVLPSLQALRGEQWPWTRSRFQVQVPVTPALVQATCFEQIVLRAFVAALRLHKRQPVLSRLPEVCSRIVRVISAKVRALRLPIRRTPDYFVLAPYLIALQKFEPSHHSWCARSRALWKAR